MNAEVIKAMNRKNKKHPIRDWWKKNEHKVMRVVLLPIWVPVWAYDKISTKIRVMINSKQEWSEERVNEILNYYVPRRAHWNAEENTFYLFDNGYGWSIDYTKKYLKRKDRRWWRVYNSWSGGQIRDYLMNNFELEGFTKKLGDCSDGWTEISFVKIEERG